MHSSNGENIDGGGHLMNNRFTHCDAIFLKLY